MIFIVDNYITVKDYTPQILSWCKCNLIIDNPDYYKKQQMGKWTGNTPKEIWLFEKDGNSLKLPFGMLNQLWNMYPDKSMWKPQIKPLKRLLYDSNINLYPYQEKAVCEALHKKNGILVMPTGSGKTQTALEIISRIGGKALWLTHTQDLLNQSKARAESVLGQGGYGTITAGKVNIGTHITFATVQTMAKLNLTEYCDAWDVVVVDECMPGNTLIDTPNGKKELKNLCIGDIITSYNRNKRKIENKCITHIFKSKAHDIVKVKLLNGEEIICTKNHPIYTRSGIWVNAERLMQNDYVLRLVWKRSGDGQYAVNDKIQDIKTWLLLLLKRMFRKRWSQKEYLDRGAQKKGIREHEEDEYKISFTDSGKDDKKQSYEKSGSAESGIRQIKRNWTQATDKMWKRHGAYCATAKFSNQISRLCECLYRISNSNKNEKRFRLSDLLQGGYSDTRKNGSNRGRWQISLFDRTPKTRQKERAVLDWIRVDSVEIQEQTSDGTFGGLCPDGYVYNVEVEDNNNYFANGVLVHNCQHAAGSPTRVTQFYKVLSSLSARYKIGLTATPKRADGLEKSMFALLGDVIHKVSRDEVRDTTCKVVVQTVETGYFPNTDMVLMGDGTLDYAKIIDDMIHNAERFKVVMREILHLYAPTMVLANRVEYLQKMCNEAKNHNMKAVCLSGQGQSKKAKVERRQALEALNNGEIDCVLATYQLAKEGLDVPNLRYVVFATPEKNSTTITQATGRVGRKAPGKEYGTVIDFLDSFGMYKGWYKKRLAVYKKIEAEVME